MGAVPTNTCARCGTAVEADEHLCWRCRQELPIQQPAATAQGTRPGDGSALFRGQSVPEGMTLPSRTQYHGTVFGAIAIGMVVVLLLGMFASRGVGPFSVSNVRAGTAVSGLSLGQGPVAAATVKNLGDRAGQARCVAYWSDAEGQNHPTPVVVTRTIEPGKSAAVSIQLPSGASTQGVQMTCK